MRRLVSSVLLVACSSQRPESPPAAPASTVTATATVTAAPAGPADASFADPPSVAAIPAPVPEPSFHAIATILYGAPAPAPSCASTLPSEARLRCLFDERYRADPKAADLAHELLVRWKIVAGVEVAHTMDGGYRGMIRLEPALPVGADRKQLEWIVQAMHDFDGVFAELERRTGAAPTSKRYRFKPLTLRFMRSPGMRTPSAYAQGWTVAWNLAGSLHTSADAVRDTLFHEIFHLNDAAHATDGDAWSFGALAAPFDAVVKKCGTAIPCLAPYSPNDTIVRGGTYYSFQPGNGVREYAAELAVRYYREQRAAFQSLPKPKPFKCGPPENARAWEAMRDEFFGGVDAVAPCR